MNKNQKYIVLTFIGICCFTGLFLFYIYIVPEWQKSINESSSSDDEDVYMGLDDPLDSAHNISLIVDFKGIKTNIEEYDFNLTDGKTTAFDAVDKWCDLEYWEGKTYITHIDGVGEGWIYWVNEKPPPPIPAIDFNLDDGDTVYWEYVGN